MVLTADQIASIAAERGDTVVNAPSGSAPGAPMDSQHVQNRLSEFDTLTAGPQPAFRSSSEGVINTVKKVQGTIQDIGEHAADETVKQQQEGGQKMIKSVTDMAEQKPLDITGKTPQEIAGEVAKAPSPLETASGAVQAIFAPITGIISAISDKASDSKHVQDFANGVGPLVDLYDQLEKKIQEIEQAYPDEAKNIGDAANVLLATMGGETGAGKADLGAAQDSVVKGITDIGGDGGPPGGGSGAVRAPVTKPTDVVAPEAKPGAKAGAPVLDKEPSKIAATIDKVAKGAPLTAKSIFSKVYRISPESSDTLIQYAHDHPEIDLHDALTQQNIHNLGKQVESEITKSKANVSSAGDIADEVQKGLQKKMQALNEHAKQYSTLGNDAKPGAPRKVVKVDPNWLKKKIQGAGLSFDEDGRVEFRSSSDKVHPINVTDSPRGAQIMQNLWDEYGPKFATGQMSRDTFLKFRQSLAQIANYPGGVDTAIERVGHGIRDAFNKEYRKQVPNLEDIDIEHSKLQRDLDESLTGIATIDHSTGLDKINMNEGAIGNIMNADKETRAKMAARLETIVPGITKKITEAKQFEDEWKSIVDERGNLRENALMNLKNSLNAGRDIRLEKLEKLMPGITDKLKLIHAADEYHNAMKGLPGMYVGASAMSQIFTGNPLLGIAGAIATQPNVGLKILQTLGRAGKGVKK